MAQKLTYKRELFDFVNELTPINNSIAFERDGDRVVVRKSDKNRTLPYIISVPASYLDIEETLAFYKFDDFHKFLKSMKNADLTLDDPNIVISSGRRSMDYRLSLPEGIINGPKDVDFEEWDAVFTLSAEELQHIRTMNGNVKGNKALISVVDDQVTIDFYSSGQDNTGKTEIECERISKNTDDFSFVINANRFEYLPTKRDYTVRVSSENFVNFSLINDEIDFDMYSGEST